MNTILRPGDQLVAPANPFVGLRSYEPHETLLFFGRDELTKELLGRLQRTRFVAVVGSSGSGKSSLVRAGLIPKLQGGFLAQGRDRWKVITLKPGDSPLHNLAKSVIEITKRTLNEENILELLRDIDGTDVEAITRWLQPALEDGPSNVLVLVDQFEEVFTHEASKLTPNVAQQHEVFDFISIILDLARVEFPIYVVLTMRSDYIGDCDAFVGLPELLNQSQYLVPRLDRRQRTTVIEGPIKVFGAGITDNLVGTLLKEIRDDNDQLPVLQYALMRTWSCWKNQGSQGPIDVPCYEEAGRIAGAIKKDAENVYQDPAANDLHDVIKKIFQSLTQLDTNNRGVRRYLRLSALQAETESKLEDIRRALNLFGAEGRSFLLQSNDSNPLINISHESLIRQWDRLDEWVKEEALAADSFKTVERAARNWKRTKNRDDLLQGYELDRALEWHNHGYFRRAWAVRYGEAFDLAINCIEASREAREKQLQEKERQREQRHRDELERERLKAEVEYQKRRSAQKWLWAMACAILLALAGWTGLFLHRNKVDREQRYDLAANLLGRAGADLQNPLAHDITALMVIQAHRVLINRGLASRLLDPISSLMGMFEIKEVAKTKETLKNHLLHFNQNQYQVFGNTLPFHLLQSLALSSNGKNLATADYDGIVLLWDLTASHWSAERRAVASNEDLVTMAYSPNGRVVGVVSTDKNLTAWIQLLDPADKSNDRQKMPLLNYSLGSVIALSNDSKYLASFDGTIVSLWALDKNDRPVVLNVPLSPDRKQSSGPQDSRIEPSLAFDPEGKSLAISRGRELFRWNLDAADTAERLSESEHDIVSIAHSEEGVLASLDVTGTVRRWKPEADVTETILYEFPKGYLEASRKFGVSGNGMTLASTTPGGKVTIWSRSLRNEESSDPDRLVEDLCKKVRRALTFGEWRLLVKSGNLSELATATCPQFREEDAENFAMAGFSPAAIRSFSKISVERINSLKELADGILEFEKEARTLVFPIPSFDPKALAGYRMLHAKTPGMESKIAEVFSDLGNELRKHGFSSQANWDDETAEKLFANAETFDPYIAGEINVFRLEWAEWMAAGHKGGDLVIAHGWLHRAMVRPSLEAIRTLNNLCASGSLAESLPKHHKIVLQWCNDAIKAQPNNLGALYHRAIVRARIGDIRGAGEDIKNFNVIRTPDGNLDQLIQTLNNGVNPFSDKLIKSQREERLKKIRDQWGRRRGYEAARKRLSQEERS